MRTLVSFYLCFALLASTPLLASTQKSSADLDALIDIGLNYAERSIEERQTAIEQALVILEVSATEQTEQHTKVDLALSYLQYQSGDIERALATLKACRDQIAKDHWPELYVRSTALMAGLLNASGQTLESLNMLEELFDAELPEAQAKRVAYARANYASTLSELGRIEDASRAYEQVLVYAQSEANDLLTLIAGTNYILLLDDLGLAAEAAYWLGQLEPLRARLPNSPASAGLELHDLNQLLSSADPESIITKIEAFLASPTTRSDLIVARAILLYADALRSAGRLDQSLEAAQKALEMLRDYPLRLPDVHFAIVKTLLAKKNFAAAENQLQQAEKLGVLRPTRLVTLHGLRLEHALGIGDAVRGTTAFDAYMVARNALSDLVNNRQSDYHHERLRNQRTELELVLARETQALLSAEATAQKAQASELRTRLETSQERRKLQFAIAATLVLSVLGLIFLNTRRRYQQKLQLELSNKNASLSVAVEEKSRELVKKITEQAQLENALAERNRMESIGQIAGHVAHDFNNTLQVVSGANSLLEPLAKTDSHKRVLNASNQSIHTGGATVRQLLAYSRHQQLESTVFRVDSYLNNNSSLFRSAIGEINSLRVENSTNDATLKLDSGQLTSSLINLMRNAADAMDTAGEIILRAQRQQGMVQISVTDPGRGMSEEQADRALEPYYTTKTAEMGTGLGLSSVYGFVLQSGGEIKIDSQLNQGTTVSLLFAEYAGAEHEASPAQPVDSMLNNSNVMVVEDNALIAQTLEAMLKQEGAQTDWVQSADAAQTKLAAGQEFDLILSDINILGSMNGFDFARWIRSAHPDTQVGIISGYGPTIEQDFDIPILAKPFSREQLLAYLSDRGFAGARTT